MRFQRPTGPDGRFLPVSPERRFWKRVDKQGPEECWNWLGAKDKDGYGVFRAFKESRAHRVSYILWRGEIGASLVCHACDNPSCVNPVHLFLGSHQDNASDRQSKGRYDSIRGEKHYTHKSPEKRMRGSKHGNSILNEDTVLLIKGRLAQGDRGIDIASDLGLTKSHVSLIKCGKAWSWL